ncbi:hypothetical protein GFS24_03955 [Chitinophaga sp. SYP-B3965]|uniref:hypothetical protein n=1 Tax=Chitinophaga sp. SYP-B3965 TaxID=2663120 RepID=UPI001299D5B1|nr:hypothetical protein [Chitinophaga sp. SYP-B3965]MRG44251.1 hypothetical protein [Chitinophaga sp. SYP-B3965]
MKSLHTYFIALMLLTITMAGCQKDDNFLVKEEAFALTTSGFNGSDSELQITIDTMTSNALIDAGRSFNRTDRYTFPASKNSIKLAITEKKTGKPVYEKEVKKGEYTLVINLFYVNGKLIEKPVAPANNPDGFRLVSYLFLPSVSNYTGDIDIVYYKKYEIIENGQFKLEKKEELARIKAKAYTFSEFLKAPSFPGGRTEIDGKVYYVNPELRFFKSGTDINYYEDAGFTIASGVSLPLLFNTKPQIVAITESGTPAAKYINSYQQTQF